MAMGIKQLPIHDEYYYLGDAQNRDRLHPATDEDAARKPGSSRGRDLPGGGHQDTAERASEETIFRVFQAPGP